MPQEFSPYVGPRRLRRNLVLVTDHEMDLEDDYRRMMAYIREVARDVEPCILPRARLSRWDRLKFAMRPTLVFSPTNFGRPRFFRGTRRHGERLPKHVECAALAEAGVPVPRWFLLTRDSEPDLSDFGPYVVMKPDRGGRGADVKIRRKGRVRFKRPAEYQGRESGWIVQEFIYTGKWPVSYRITTLFGHVVHAWRAEASHSRTALSARYDFGSTGGIGIVSSHKGCTFTLKVEEDILEIAREAAAAMPDFPLLGVDVVRDADTGKLYVLELNSSGYVWQFSSKAGMAIQQEFNLDLETPFDGIRKSAMILLSETRRLAR